MSYSLARHIHEVSLNNKIKVIDGPYVTAKQIVLTLVTIGAE